MKSIHAGILLIPLLVAPASISAQSGVEVEFAETEDFDFGSQPPADLVVDRTLTEAEKDRLQRAIRDAARDVGALMPALTGDIHVTVVLVDRELDVVGGVSGRADAPGELFLELAIDYDGGVAAQMPAFTRTLYHEMHHLARGWTIAGNRFGPGIAIAAVNEGLAEVFAEEQTGVMFESSEYPENADEWAREILALPPDADYGHWMFQHPDGRQAIGYRTGRYIIHQAMARSGKSVLELSELEPEEILRLAGVE
ncbi:MAG: DUF2268 domain-containing putative Zn-dependent protease [Gemmatimonadota bacterium]|nr:DUF2268 domain-containing putative Zn-dependent protease [Gemmatimonadota bacterium]